jgi:hypothetical protein
MYPPPPDVSAAPWPSCRLPTDAGSVNNRLREGITSKMPARDIRNLVGAGHRRVIGHAHLEGPRDPFSHPPVRWRLLRVLLARPTPVHVGHRVALATLLGSPSVLRLPPGPGLAFGVLVHRAPSPVFSVPSVRRRLVGVLPTHATAIPERDGPTLTPDVGATPMCPPRRLPPW